MAEHDWPDELASGNDPRDDVEVRHVQPYEAVKAYRCPGCDLDIRVGEGHKVVVPVADPRERRHWHTGCWHRASKRGHRPH